MPSAPSLVGLVLAAGPALIDPIHPGEVIVGRVVTAQGEVGGGRNEKTGDVPAAGQAIERFRCRHDIVWQARLGWLETVQS